MLTLTYESGRKLERRFCGVIATEEDFLRFIAEARYEFENSDVPIFGEIWGELRKAEKTPKGGDQKSRHKKVLMS